MLFAIYGACICHRFIKTAPTSPRRVQWITIFHHRDLDNSKCLTKNNQLQLFVHSLLVVNFCENAISSLFQVTEAKEKYTTFHLWKSICLTQEIFHTHLITMWLCRILPYSGTTPFTSCPSLLTDSIYYNKIADHSSQQEIKAKLEQAQYGTGISHFHLSVACWLKEINSAHTNHTMFVICPSQSLF